MYLIYNTTISGPQPLFVKYRDIHNIYEMHKSTTRLKQLSFYLFTSYFPVVVVLSNVAL